MNNLYVVESPLQALCALEVSLNKTNYSNNIVVKLSSEKNSRHNKQILSIVNKREWDKKLVLTTKMTHSSYINHRSNKRFLDSVAKTFSGKVTNLYIGEFRSYVMHMARVATKAQTVFLLDDGAVTVKVINRYLLLGYNYPYDMFYPENILKKIAFKCLYKSYINHSVFDQDLKVVTAFQSDYNKVQLISFKETKKLISKKQEIDSSLVFYFGSKYSEVGIVSENYEMSFLNRVKDFYIDKNVVYFAHRAESQKKLSYINDVLGFKVLTPDITAEVFLLEYTKLPAEVAGAYTSVLNNIKVIYPDIKIRSFRLDPVEITTNFKKDIKLIYDHYNDIGINIVD